MHINDILGQNSYAQKLSSTQWVERAKSYRKAMANSCKICRRGDKPTHVHHIWYEKDVEPWDHPDEALRLFCVGCHHAMHEQLSAFRKHVFGHLTPAQFKVLNGSLAVGVKKYDVTKLVYAIAELVSSPGSVERFSQAWVAHPSAEATATNPKA